MHEAWQVWCVCVCVCVYICVYDACGARRKRYAELWTAALGLLAEHTTLPYILFRQ